MYPNNSFHTN